MKQTQEIKLILKKVSEYISEHKFPPPGDVIQLALSGGRDSMVLLDVMVRLGFRVVALHVNYGLRGSESERDERFVAEVCAQNNIPLEVLRVNPASLRGNVQQEAREIRYQWFRARSNMFTATGHHRQDQAETTLMRLFQGTGLDGLAGIKPEHDRIIRPLLCLNADDIEAYARLMRINFVHDSSNDKEIYLRNEIRHRIIPVIQNQFPKGMEGISQSANHLYHVSNLLGEFLEMSRDRYQASLPGGIEEWNLGELFKLKEGALALFYYFKNYGLNYATASQIAMSWNQSAGKMYQTHTHEMVTFGSHMLVRALVKAQQQDVYIQKIESSMFLQFGSFSCTFELDKTIHGKPQRMGVDMDKLKFPLTIRSRKTGDRFKPLGMKAGSKLLSDWMTDRKMSPWDKAEGPVIVDAENNIVMVYPHGVSELFKIDSDTKCVLWFEAIRN